MHKYYVLSEKPEQMDSLVMDTTHYVGYVYVTTALIVETATEVLILCTSSLFQTVTVFTSQLDYTFAYADEAKFYS